MAKETTWTQDVRGIQAKEKTAGLMAQRGKGNAVETGSKRRLNRLLDRRSGKTVMVALDHGFTGGPLPGFESYAKISGWIDHPSINALVLHRGALALLTRRGFVLDTPVIIQSNGMSLHAANPSVKPVLVEAEEATRLGADALSFEFSAGADAFADNLRALSKQISAASYFGLPVMVMLAIDDCPMESRVWVKTHRDICRTLIDLGASIIKLRQPPAKEDWHSLMEEMGSDSLFVMAGGRHKTTMRSVNAFVWASMLELMVSALAGTFFKTVPRAVFSQD